MKARPLQDLAEGFGEVCIPEALARTDLMPPAKHLPGMALQALSDLVGMSLVRDRGFGHAPTAKQTLARAVLAGLYPWGAGEVLRYNKLHTFVLAVAVDAFLKRQVGPQGQLWDMVVTEVLGAGGPDYSAFPLSGGVFGHAAAGTLYGRLTRRPAGDTRDDVGRWHITPAGQFWRVRHTWDQRRERCYTLRRSDSVPDRDGDAFEFTVTEGWGIGLYRRVPGNPEGS